MAAVDYKKMQRDLYQPGTSPSVVEVPRLAFLLVAGSGDPNTSEEYTAAVETLYGLSYTIKMSGKSIHKPDGYFDYVVPPLEGLWQLDDGGEFRGGGAAITDKSKFSWTMLLRQPEFVTPAVVDAAKAALAKKKPRLDLSLVRFEPYAEGLCVQVMHIGSYDDEPETVARLARFVAENGYQEDFSAGRRHHEIYLSDPRKTAPEKLRTIIRHPIKARG
ncbi:MAG: GyrI-like domain-containing protein [Propionibacteriaceae bacterium]|jgi:hypothetical protein|nr:GyrI-like domain-containing protein [Propionibacteriaceae bacterium]